MAYASIHQGFEAKVAATPEQSAISSDQGVITYADLSRRSNAVALALCRNHDAHPTIIGLCFELGVDYVAAMLGVLKSGAAFLPIAVDTPVHRLAAMLEMATPEHILTNAAHAGALRTQLVRAGHEVSLLVTDELPPCDTMPPVDAGPNSLCYLLFTSGSTGRPKAVAGCHASLRHFIDWEIQEFRLDASCRISLLAAPTFDVSLRDILVPLLAGGCICIPDESVRTQPRALLDWLHTERVTQVHCVPSLFRLLLSELERRPGVELPDLQRILLAGEPLYARDVRRWRRAMSDRIELVNLYGPTETTLAKACYRIREIPDTENGIVPIGSGIADTELLLIRDGQLCDSRQIGEIYIRTAFRSKGYYGDPELTAACFIPNPLSNDPDDIIYRTGDQGRYRADRTVEFIGRLDNQIKFNGIRIELGEVEAHLLQHPQVQEAVVIVHRDSDSESRLVAYFVAAERLDPESLREHLASYMPTNMHPNLFIQMDRLPLNLHGKIDRRALPAPTELLYESRDFVAPQGATETDLARIWGALLGLESVAADRTFVELGGDSLKAIRAIGELYKAFDIEVSLRVFFEQGTIQKLATWLTESGGQNA
ncbi:MAG: non-ribosomal peptide synthetase [Lentisphaerae bacterium]|nr:non-ribosomal peptide synthetase [Lentisphaerota bacterium]